MWCLMRVEVEEAVGLGMGVEGGLMGGGREAELRCAVRRVELGTDIYVSRKEL